MALIENIQREDLNPLEQAAGLKRLVDEFGLTHDEAAQAIGSSRSQASNLLRLLGLAASVQALLREGRIDMGHARALLALDGARQVEIANRVAALGLSVRQTEQLVRDWRAQPASSARRRPEPPLTQRRLAEALQRALGTKVDLQRGRKGGKLVIHYYSDEELDGLYHRIVGEDEV
jgi:ParB family chromosome partitioning protein